MIKNYTYKFIDFEVRKWRIIWGIPLMFFFLANTFGQIDVKGKISDTEGEPLIGVNVQVKGTTQGTASDFDGEYSLNNVDADATLVFSYVGYETKEVQVEGETTIDVVLISDVKLLEEVVVVGYGKQKRVNVVGSVTAISGKEVESVPAPDVTNAISGRLAGSVIM